MYIPMSPTASTSTPSCARRTGNDYGKDLLRQHYQQQITESTDHRCRPARVDGRTGRNSVVYQSRKASTLGRSSDRRFDTSGAACSSRPFFASRYRYRFDARSDTFSEFETCAYA